jgi:periplasmic protein CpxP/Spy
MILFAAVITTANIKAQGPNQPPPPKKTPEERAEMITKNMTKNLNLNPDQQAKIKTLIIKREKEREAMQANMKGKHEEMEKQMDAEFQKILNPEQFEKFKKRQEEMKKKRMERKEAPEGDGKMPPPPPGEE